MPDPTAGAMTPAATPRRFELQGHRGARGLLPENTIPAFLAAVDLGVDTVELDVVVSADRRLVVSHDPWFDPQICSRPDRTPVTAAEAERLPLFALPYHEIARYDCGRRGHPLFPRQRPMPAVKPILADAIRAVEARVAERRRRPVLYNIETKCTPAGDGVLHPGPEEFARLLYGELRALDVLDRATVQSFDVRTLQIMRALDPAVTLSLLVEGGEDRGGAAKVGGSDVAGGGATAGGMSGASGPAGLGGPGGRGGGATSGGEGTLLGGADRLAADLERLGFAPGVYSPDFRLVDAPMMREAHVRGIRVIPWTVNSREEMLRLIDLGVDGLITDYPDLGQEVMAERYPRFGAVSIVAGKEKRHMEAKFFATPSEFGGWLEEHHDQVRELWVGFYKKGSGRPSITWPEAVDEALRYGWIDGVRKSIDGVSYAIRFTPRKPQSTWSAVNIRRVQELIRAGRMRPSGLETFARRKEERSRQYSFEQEEVALGEQFEARFRANEAAWTFFESQPPSYRKAATWWVVSARREETRRKRLETLIQDSAAGQRIAPLRRDQRKGTGGR